MPKEILKNNANELVVKIVNEASSNIPLSDGDFDFDGDTSDETPTELVIREVILTGDGVVTINRNSIAVLAMNGNVRITETMDEEKDQQIDITAAATNYTLILKMSKRY